MILNLIQKTWLGIHIAVLIVSAAFQTMAQTTQPRLVEASTDGSILLHAFTAKISGTEIAYMPEWKALGWFREDGLATWEAHIIKSGTYDVYLEWSVSDEEAGKGFVLQAGKQRIKGIVGKSGSWETFKKVKIGQVSLKKGKTRFTFQPEKRFGKGALLDLREIQLIPSH